MSSTHDERDVDLSESIGAGAEDDWADPADESGAPFSLTPSEWSTRDVRVALAQALVIVGVVTAVLLLLVFFGRLSL